MSRYLALAFTLLVACTDDSRNAGPLEIQGAPPRTIAVTAGEEFFIRLQTVGPGEYRSPPEVTGAAVAFRDVSLASPAVPAGPTQLFRFTALARGQAVVRFTHTGQSPVVTDTVVVR